MHAINYVSGIILSIFSGSSYFQTIRRTADREATSWAWRSYWEQATGTFNALLEREFSLPSPLSRSYSGGWAGGRAAGGGGVGCAAARQPARRLFACRPAAKPACQIRTL